jgi:hypothetical protein
MSYPTTRPKSPARKEKSFADAVVADLLIRSKKNELSRKAITRANGTSPNKGELLRSNEIKRRRPNNTHEIQKPFFPLQSKQDFNQNRLVGKENP